MKLKYASIRFFKKRTVFSNGIIYVFSVHFSNEESQNIKKIKILGIMLYFFKNGIKLGVINRKQTLLKIE